MFLFSFSNKVFFWLLLDNSIVFLFPNNGIVSFPFSLEEFDLLEFPNKKIDSFPLKDLVFKFPNKENWFSFSCGKFDLLLFPYKGFEIGLLGFSNKFENKNKPSLLLLAPNNEFFWILFLNNLGF